MTALYVPMTSLPLGYCKPMCLLGPGMKEQMASEGRQRRQAQGFKGKVSHSLGSYCPEGRELQRILKGSPQSPAGVPDSSCHCSVLGQGTLTPLLSVGKNNNSSGRGTAPGQEAQCWKTGTLLDSRKEHWSLLPALSRVWDCCSR